MASSFHIKLRRAEVAADGTLDVKLSGGNPNPIRSLRLSKYSFVSDTACDKLSVQVNLPFISIGLHRTSLEGSHVLSLPLNFGGTVTNQRTDVDLMMLEDRIPKSFKLTLSDEDGVAFSPAGADYELNLWFDYVEKLI